MPVPDPSPGATMAPQPPGAGSDSIINQFADSSPVATSKKPSTAFQQFGPLSGRTNRNQSWQYMNDLTPTQGQPITKSVVDMSNEYYNWTDKQKNDFRSKLALVNKDALIAPDSTIAAAWGDYVQQSANYFSAGATVSPWDILSRDISTRGQAASLAGTKTQTTRDVQLTSAPDAQAIFHSAAQALLGRNASSDEETSFQKILNAKEAANPTTATVTTTTDAEGNVINTSRQSQGGISSAAAQMIAEKQAQQNPEYAQYQASTTYYNAMMQELMRGY
jgi:hypothetical protein